MISSQMQSSVQSYGSLQTPHIGQSGSEDNGYGVVYNPCPDYSNEAIDYSNLYNVGRKWTRFEGSFVKGNKDGPGNIYLSNGYLFSGMFKGDVAEGKGSVCFDGKVLLKGTWRNNKLQTSFQ